MNRLELLRPLLANGALARSDAPFRLLTVVGPDAGEFLHRLCTQDVLGLAAGTGKAAAFLDAKGKLLVTCVVFRGENGFGLEVMADQVDKLAALLERYHFTEKLAITVVPPQPVHETVAWTEAGRMGGVVVESGGGRTVLTQHRRGLTFVRVHGGAIDPASGGEVGSAGSPAARMLLPDVAECLRMAAGLVRVGQETEPTTLALEADLEDHVSTTKGCYTGQEIVARIHTYGHVNRKLCLLHLPAGPAIDAPQPLHEREDKLAVGRVMHAVPLPEDAGRLGTGYLPKDFQELGTKLALADGTVVEVIGYEALGDLPA